MSDMGGVKGEDWKVIRKQLRWLAEHDRPAFEQLRAMLQEAIRVKKSHRTS